MFFTTAFFNINGKCTRIHKPIKIKNTMQENNLEGKQSYVNPLVSKNRVIKFRAWDNERNLMIYDFENIEHPVAIEYFFSANDGILTIGAYKHNGDYYELEPMLSTGLMDKNNNPIYEFDIIKGERMMFAGYAYDGSEEMEDFIGLVTFDDSAYFVGHIPFMSIDQKAIEIIGNWFENPELLTNK